MQTRDALWRGLAPGLAVGGALLVASAFWLFVTVGPEPAEGSVWLLAAGLTGLGVVVGVALGQNETEPLRGSEFRRWRLPWLAVAACLVGVAVAWWRVPSEPEVAGPAWPVALAGFAVASLGFALMAARARVRPVPASAADGGEPKPIGGGGVGLSVAVVVALAMPVAVFVAVVPRVRTGAADLRVNSGSFDPPVLTGTPVQRWAVPAPAGEVVGGAWDPVVRSEHGVEGLDPATGARRWWVRHHDRTVVAVEAADHWVLVTWTVYPMGRVQGEKRVRTLIAAVSGAVRAETADESTTIMVGDLDTPVQPRPDGCRDAPGGPGTGLLVCGSAVRRFDGWTIDPAPGIVAHKDGDGLLLSSYGQGTAWVDHATGTVRWRSDRRLDDLVGVTDGLVIWRDGGGAGGGTVTLSAVDLATGAQKWTTDTGLRAWSPSTQARAIGAARQGYVDIVHAGARDRPAVTRFSAKTGTVAGPALQLDVRVSRSAVPAWSESAFVLDTGDDNPQLLGIV